ncbi:hypothetical protein M9435_006095 [Picochlorum sp. BPE23]|nr:hypothetical protein M9435_006095 [Picochlorum sp. BPE23]
MKRGIILALVALCGVCSVTVEAQNPSDILDNLGIGGILDDVNLDDIIAAGEKCDTDKIAELSQACSESVTDETRVCTPECQAFFDGVGESCADLIKVFGLEDIVDVCDGGDFNIDPVSDSTPTTPADDSTPTTPADDSTPSSTPDSIGAGEQIAENIEAGSDAITRSVSVGVALALALL